jgi:hypothetical protein
MCLLDEDYKEVPNLSLLPLWTKLGRAIAPVWPMTRLRWRRIVASFPNSLRPEINACIWHGFAAMS